MIDKLLGGYRSPEDLSGEQGLLEQSSRAWVLERLNEGIQRRTLVVRIFPNEASCLRLIRALAVEMHENWIEATRYLGMEDLRQHK